MAKKTKFTKGPEVLWAVIFIFSLGISAHKTYYFGFTESMMFYGFIFLALTMYLIRKKMRIKRELEDEE